MTNSKHVGDRLEALVRKSADAQKKQGLKLDQTSVRVAMKGRMGQGGMIKGRALGKADCDFVGDYLGRIVRFDAKSTGDDRRFRLTDLRRNQVKRIRDTHARGGVAFFLVELREAGTYWAMTWPFLKSWWDEYDLFGEPASIPFDAIRAGCVPIGRPGALLDLVGVVRTLQERMAAA